MDQQTKKNFNTSHVTVYQILLVFFITFGCNFNTSHVTVYQFKQDFTADSKDNFNTSHVTVYPPFLQLTEYPTDFNTSHVTVYHLMMNMYKVTETISIHLMLRFI